MKYNVSYAIFNFLKTGEIGEFFIGFETSAYSFYFKKHTMLNKTSSVYYPPLSSPPNDKDINEL
jgi:hypothetical protein